MATLAYKLSRKLDIAQGFLAVAHLYPVDRRDAILQQAMRTLDEAKELLSANTRSSS